MLHTFVALVQDKPGVLTCVASLLLCVTAFIPRTAQATVIKVRLIDGRTGNKIQSDSVTLFDMSKNSYPLIIQGRKDEANSYDFEVEPEMNLTLGTALTTSQNGNAYLPCYPDKHQKDIRFSPAVIVATGMVSPNDCSRNVAAPPVPGELIVFVRPLTRWEKFIRSLDK